MTKLTFQRVNNSLIIRPMVTWLDKELTFRRKVGREFNTHLKRQVPVYEDEILYSTQKDLRTNETVCITYGGLFTRLVNKAKKNEHTIAVENYQTLLPPPDINKIKTLPPLREGQDITLASITSAYRGIIVEPTGNGKTFIITSLCHIYPHIKILIVVPGKVVLKEMIERVNVMCPNENINRIGGGPRKTYDGARITVSTNMSLHHIPPDWPDMILYDEGHSAASRSVVKGLNRFEKATLIGLTASPKGRKDGSDIVTEALFGSVIREVKYQEAVKMGNIANIKVFMLCLDDPDFSEFTRDIDRERFGYWLNHARNKMFVDKAKELFRRDEPVIFMVSKTEHALALKALLPDVPMAHGKITPERWEKMGAYGVTKGLEYKDVVAVDQEQLKADFLAGKVSWCIATHVWKQAVDTKDLAGLVRLDGMASKILDIQIPGRLSRTGSDGKKTWGILLDSMDAYGASYYRRSEQRQNDYKEQGWQIHEV